MSKKPPRFSVLTMRLYWRATIKYPKSFAASLLAPLSLLLISVAIPFAASNALSASFSRNGDFWRYFLLLIVSAAFAVIFNRAGTVCFLAMQARVLHDLQHQVFDSLMRRGLRFHTNTIGGKLVSDAIDFTNAYIPLSNMLMLQGGPFALSLIVGMIIILVLSWQLGVYLMITVAVTLFWAYRDSLRRYGLRGKRLVATKKLLSHVSDSIVNAATVKMFSAEKRETHANDALSRTLRDLRVRDWQLSSGSANKRLGVLLAFLTGMILVVYATGQANSAMLGASIFAFTYALTLIIRLFDINNMLRTIEEAFLQASPMTNILHEDVEVQDVPHAANLLIDKGEINFQNVSFSYTDSQSGQNVFTKLDMTIKPGEHVGLVGPSGGGKTTLTRLLLRFEDVQSGAILIDGQDIREVTQASLRDAVGYVPQEPLLFHRSIRENITYGKPVASDRALKTAARLAYADDFIAKLPQGYDTIVGERGVKLSGGQRQRVAIARALLKNAPILVLDEATSALDSENEQLIQEAMWQLLADRTALVIAHRLSTIQRMDRIIVLDEGKIVEQGTHKELLALKGTYAKLWQHQSGGFLEEN